MDEYNVFIGGLSGVFKGKVRISHSVACRRYIPKVPITTILQIPDRIQPLPADFVFYLDHLGFNVSKNKGIHSVKNLQNLKEITQRNEVTVLNWSDKTETEILIGYGNQLVKVYDLNTRTFVFNEPKEIGNGPIRGIFKVNSSVVTAVESGTLKVWGDNPSTIETGGPLSCMRQSPNEENIAGTGGKENELKLWDLETGKTTFIAKNVRHDELELRVPVWVMDLAFRSQSKQVAVATRYGHVRLYDPSTTTRRPVSQVSVKDHSFTCIAPAPQEHHYMVGCTTGNMYLVDLRSKGLLLNKYKGFMGSVKQLACLPSEPYVLSVSLDRHFRIHHLNSKKLMFKEYMQSRLSTLLLKSSFTMEDVKEEEKQEVPDSVEPVHEHEVDEEYEEMFDKMEVIIDQPIQSLKVKSQLKDKSKKSKLDSTTNVEVENVGLDSEEENATSTRSNTRKRRKSKRLKLDSEIIDD